MMKANDLTEGQRISYNGRQGTVTNIRRRVRFEVIDDKGKAHQWYVDGEVEITAVDQQRKLP
jgi:hypothetical protein